MFNKKKLLTLLTNLEAGVWYKIIRCIQETWRNGIAQEKEESKNSKSVGTRFNAIGSTTGHEV